MDFLDRRGWRSPRPPPRRALQSLVYIRKKAAASKREKKNAKILMNQKGTIQLCSTKQNCFIVRIAPFKRQDKFVCSFALNS